MTGEQPAAPPPGEPPATPPTTEPGPPAERATIVVTDDLERSRLTVFFRLILVIPHLIVLALFSILALVIAIINWFWALFTRNTVAHDMQSRYLRYATHVLGYLNLAANPYPGFEGAPGSYPLDPQIPPQEPQNRWKTGFRLVLIFPAATLASALGVTASSSYSGYYSFGLITTVAFLAWFAIMAIGRMPRGLRDLSVYCLNYGIQYWAYLLIVTDRYPDSDPLTRSYGPDPAPDHPIRISEDAELRRSRLTVFFRLLLFLPHYVWLVLWGIAVFFTVIANWFVTLFAGRPADALHRFNGAYLRYTHARLLVPVSRHQRVPRLRRRTRQLPRRPADRPARAPEPLEDRLPHHPRVPRALRRQRGGRSAGPRGHLRLVRRVVPRPDAARACGTSASSRSGIRLS